jgi:subtilisin-like proprotein convertase family protein
MHYFLWTINIDAMQMKVYIKILAGITPFPLPYKHTHIPVTLTHPLKKDIIIKLFAPFDILFYYF